MKYIAPKAEVVKIDIASIILTSIFCVTDNYNGGDLWEDDATNDDFYNN